MVFMVWISRVPILAVREATFLSRSVRGAVLWLSGPRIVRC